MKLSPKSQEVFDCIKNCGGKASIEEIATTLNRTTRSINANVTDLTKKELAVREKVAADEDKTITYAVLTEAGKDFVPTEDAE